MFEMWNFGSTVCLRLKTLILEKKATFNSMFYFDSHCLIGPIRAALISLTLTVIYLLTVNKSRKKNKNLTFASVK